MKNRDYTLIVRDVTPADQQYVGWLFNALHELFAKLGSVGNVLKTEPSPEPVVPEVWIVEVEQSISGWQQSGNKSTRTTFNTQAEAEAAIRKNWSKGHGVHLRYRAVRTEPTRVEALALTRLVVLEPAEVWIVEFKTGENKPFQRSANRFTKGKFTSKAAAEKAIEEKLRFHNSSLFSRSDYRVRRVSPTEPAEQWIDVTEQWIVEVEYSRNVWYPSENFHTRGMFATKEQAEVAILKNKEVGDEKGMKYRVRQLDVPVEEQWIVEFKLDGGWHRSGNTSTRVVFNTQAEAQKAADAERDGFKYRVRQII